MSYQLKQITAVDNVFKDNKFELPVFQKNTRWQLDLMTDRPFAAHCYISFYADV